MQSEIGVRVRERVKERQAAPRQFWADFTLLFLAVAILWVPPWRDWQRRRELRTEERPVRRLSIGINSAPWYEWTLVDGIGETRARHIVEYRDRHGPFKSIADLTEIPGLPGGWVSPVESILTLR